MKQQEYFFSIPDGYTLLKQEEVIELDEAVKLLSGKKQRRYSFAVHQDNGASVKLVRHSYLCPYCGRRTPAYFRYLNPGEESPYRVVPKNQVEEWGTAQLKLFRMGNPEMVFNWVHKPEDRRFRCCFCGCVSRQATGQRQVKITASKKMIVYSCQVITLQELLSLPWLPKNKLTLQFPIFETVTFHLASGKSYLTLEDINGEAIAKRDMTAFPEFWKGSLTYTLLRDHHKIARIIRRLFEGVFGGSLPFAGKDLTPKEYLLMTRFIGYPREFYDAIPFLLGGGKVEGTFRRIAKAIHAKEGALRLLKNSALPDMRSVRKAMFSLPGLFFYLEEAELLWKLLPDPNLFCRVMRYGRPYLLLAFLHQRPTMAAFFADYGKVMGKTALTKCLVEEDDDLCNYAINYCSLSPQLQLAEQKKWKDHDFFFCEEKGLPAFSLPMRCPTERVFDCTLDGFSFRWLRNMSEFYHAGKALNNCLSEWSPDRNPVVMVSKNGVPVGAIEVRGDVIIQARGKGNSHVSETEGLEEVCAKWKKLFGLSDELFIYNRFEVEEFPF